MPALPPLLKILVAPNRQDLQALNLVFIPAVLVAGVMLGSVISVVIISGGVWAAMQLLRPSVTYTRKRTVWQIAFCFAFLFAAELLAGLINNNGWKTALEIAENLPFLLLLPLYSVFFAPRQALQSHLEKAAIAVSFIAALIAIVQFNYYGLRAGGAGNAGVFGVMNLILFTVNLLTIARHRDSEKWIAGLAMLASAAALILSGMRSLWPALLVLPVLIFLIYGRGMKMRLSRKTLSILMPMMVFAAWFLLEPVRDRINAGFHDFVNLTQNNYQTSLGERVVLWKAAAQLIAEKPLFGHGPGLMRSVMIEKTWAISGTPLYFSHFHNAFLTYWVRSGVFGVLSLILVLLGPFLILRKKVSDDTGRYGLALLVSVEVIYFMSGLFGIMFGQDLMDTVFIVSVALAAYLILGYDDETSPARRESPVGA